MKVTLMEQGVAHHNAGRYQTAIAIFNQGLAVKSSCQGIANDSDNAGFYTRIGLAQEYLKRHGEAIMSYDAAISLNNYYADPVFNKGTLLFEMGRKTEAAVLINKSLELAPMLRNNLANMPEINQYMRIHGAQHQSQRAVSSRSNSLENISDRAFKNLYVG